MNKQQFNHPGEHKTIESTRNTFRLKSAKERADLLAFLSLMINMRPDSNFVQHFKSIDLSEIAANIHGDHFPENIINGLQDISDFLEETSHLDEEEVQKMLAVEWNKLFRGVSRKFGPTPPYEGLYLDNGGDDSKILIKLIRIYNQASLTNSRSQPDRPDYLGLELDFLKRLAQQEVMEWDSNCSDTVRHKAIQFQVFFEDHPGRWVRKYCLAALPKATNKFYRGVILIMDGVMELCSNSIADSHQEHKEVNDHSS